MKPIIKVEKLSKQYRIGARRGAPTTLSEAAGNVFRSPLRLLRRENGRRAGDMIWALRDINFEIKPGEVVGVIGHNGAGKSTLFKILARVTEPTSGRAELYGRVSSLLEVGTGFHPELTGRENIFLNGSIMGMSRGEIRRKFDEIAAFSEVEKFLDTPVKHYSSGMYTRLAFAVAAHLDPEILLVDEVLAVGDAAFQKKCLGKMSDVASAGRTVLFISHNMTAIQSLCNRVLWLNNGEIVEEAEPNKVIYDYIKRDAAVSTEHVWDDVATAPGNDKIRLRLARVRPAAEQPSEGITIRTPLALEFEYWNLEPGARLDLSLYVYNEQGIIIFCAGSLTEPAWHGKSLPAGLFRSVCHVPGNLLNDGVHRVTLFVVKNQSESIFTLTDALVFDVLDSAERRGDWHGKWAGAVRPDLEWETEYVGGRADELAAHQSL